MAVLPISIKVTQAWQDITAKVALLELIDEEVVEIFHSGGQLVEVLIDTLGTESITSANDGQGTEINGSQLKTFPYTTKTKFWVRRSSEGIKKSTQVKIRKQVQNINVGGVGITGNSLNVIDVDPSGAMKLNGIFGESFSDRIDDVSVQFQYNYFDEQFDVEPEIVTGDGVTTAANELGTVSSASVGTAMRSSRDTIQYNAGRTGYAFLTALFNGTGTGLVGSFDFEDGFALKLINGDASFGYIKGGAEKGSAGANGFDNQSVWNGNLPASEVDFEKVNIFLITYGYLGVANPTLWIKKGIWYVLHTVETEGVLIGTHVDTPVFPISIYAENGMTVSSGSWAGGVVGGRSEAAGRGFGFPNIMVSGTSLIAQGQATVPANETRTMVIFHSKEDFHGKHNHAKARLTGYDFHVDIPSGVQVGTVIFQIVGVQTLSGVPAYQDINTTSSVIEYDHDNTTGTGASVSVLTGSPIVNRNLEYVAANKGGSAADAAVDAEAIGAFAYAGSTFAVVAKNIGGVDVITRVTLNWEELF